MTAADAMDFRIGEARGPGGSARPAITPAEADDVIAFLHPRTGHDAPVIVLVLP